MRWMLILTAMLAAAAAAPAASQIDAVARLADERPPDLNYLPLTYGPGPHRRAYLVSPRTRSNPLVVILAGEDFAREAEGYDHSWIPTMLFDRGFAVARIDHRPAHEAGIAGIFEDLAAGIAELVRNSRRHRIDPQRIVLLGSGAGGQFAALLGADPLHFERAGVPFARIRGVVVLNGDAFDVPARIAAASAHLRHRYWDVFGRDAAVHAAYSPAHHAATPNAPAWLFHALPEFAAQADALAAALRAVGAQAEVRRVARSLRGSKASQIGRPQHPETALLLRFVQGATATR